MIIGLSGGMGVGKSTAIGLIKEAFFTRPLHLIKFAGPLYDMQEYIYSRISNVYKRDKSFVKDRKLLQWIGTEWGRGTISQTIWVDLWKAESTAFLDNNPGGIVVCDDARFDNEAETIRELGGMVINITSEYANKRIDTKAGIVNHASEAGIKPELIDATVKNDTTVQDFEFELLKVIKEFAARRGTKG